MSDQDIIYPYIIDTTSIQGMRIKKNINSGMTSWSNAKSIELTS